MIATREEKEAEFPTIGIFISIGVIRTLKATLARNDIEGAKQILELMLSTRKRLASKIEEGAR